MNFVSDLIDDLKDLWAGAFHNPHFFQRLAYRVLLLAYVAVYGVVFTLGALLLAYGALVVVALVSGG